MTVVGRYGDRSIVEITAIFGEVIQAIAFNNLDGAGCGILVISSFYTSAPSLRVSDGWLGRVINAFGHPLDDGPPLALGPTPQFIRSPAPEAVSRARLGARISLGVRPLDLFVTCRYGQRIGIFAGSGVGKSTLLSMLARNSASDVSVIALVGERGKEVRELLDDDLKNYRSPLIVVVSTADASPLMRRESAYAAMTIAEYFRDRGKRVLLMMDSLTRFCQSLREIAISTGELPASRGYPPTVFSELPRLLERAGPSDERISKTGSITAIFTVLVEGDDYNEPVSDSVRGMLDGHVVLDRRIAERGRFPAMDVQKSISRSAKKCNNAMENNMIMEARRLLSLYRDASELVSAGVYRSGMDAAIDRALAVAPQLETLLIQNPEEECHLEIAFAQLAQLLQHK